MKPDDPLLKSLAEAARDEVRGDPLDARWDALADDALSEEDRAALRELAAADPDAALAQRAFEPLDEAARERFADAALSALGATRAPDFEDQLARRRPRVEAAPAQTVRGAAPAEGSEGAQVIPFRPRWTRAVMLAVPLAAAAAIAFVLLRGTPDGLPAYRLDAMSGEQAVRGTEPVAGGLPTYGPGSRLELRVRPATAIDGEVAVRGFLRRGAEVTPWHVTPEVVAGGAARVAGPVETLLPDVEGEVEVILVIGRPGDLPDAAEVQAALADGRPRAWQLVRHRLLRRAGG